MRKGIFMENVAIPNMAMGMVEQVIDKVTLPKFLKVAQLFDSEKLSDVSSLLAKELREKSVDLAIKPGMRIALACGSRGIKNLPMIVKTTATYVKEAGGLPFIVPAMGSHGGATEQGQRQVLESMGITEEYCGCKIISSMKVVKIGVTDGGVQVCCDTEALKSDGIILINRVKPHTDFTGKYESGLVKMAAVGLGKHSGAEEIHRLGPDYLAERIVEAGKLVFQKSPILFGIAIIENAFDETKDIFVLRKEEIFEEEKKLLRVAYYSMARLLFSTVDVLVVDEIGKDISGIGADPNVIGRFCGNVGKDVGFTANKIIFLKLSDKTEGNSVGVGLADIITKRILDNIDFEKTYMNSITTTVLSPSKIPIVMRNDQLAIKLGVYTGNSQNLQDIRVIRIKNTKNLNEIYISTALEKEARANQRIKILSGPGYWDFNSEGDLF